MKHCFCEVPYRILAELARDKYLKGYSTESLMRRCHTGEEREYVATVALLDVAEEVLEEIIPSKEKLCHVLACRENILNLLKTAGVNFYEKVA